MKQYVKVGSRNDQCILRAKALYVHNTAFIEGFATGRRRFQPLSRQEGQSARAWPRRTKGVFALSCPCSQQMRFTILPRHLRMEKARGMWQVEPRETLCTALISIASSERRRRSSKESRRCRNFDTTYHYLSCPARSHLRSLLNDDIPLISAVLGRSLIVSTTLEQALRSIETLPDKTATRTKPSKV